MDDSKNYLLIVDNDYKRVWYQKLDSDKLMNAILIIRTYYRLNSQLFRNFQVKQSKNKTFRDYRSVPLQTSYVEETLKDIIALEYIIIKVDD